ncbi:MAG: cobalamin biosynthesis protein CobQ [Ruminiclostridium sp.]|nr:cobalamin biosynthesis protein CobQ [Ruminiclostridium sp.]
MTHKKLTVVTGHYGSGKTNLSVNIALDIAESGEKCTVIDLDIVNPYFRTADFRGLFDKRGIDIFAPVYANTNLDIPSLNIPLESLLKSGTHIVIDVGGDDEGAKALGRFAPLINATADKDVLYVINKYRYLTKEPEEAAQVMREIETSGSVLCTGIVNNSTLGAQTTEDDVRGSFGFAEKVSELTGLPISATCAIESAMPEEAPAPYTVKRYVRTAWEQD